MRIAFPGIGWQYNPSRDAKHQHILIGFASVPPHETIEVGFEYKTRGVIDTLVMDKASEHLSSSVDETFKQCVLEARENIGQKTPFRCTTTAKFSLGPRYIDSLLNCNIARYSCENFQIMPLKNSWATLELDVAGYDSTDAFFWFRYRMRGILDLLSCWTNLLWSEDHLKEPPDTNINVHANSMWSDNDWLEDAPIRNGYLQITQDQLEFIANLAGGEIDYGDDIVRSAHHFRKTLQMTADDHDLSIVLLMTCLEIASLELRQEQRCDKCGQNMYKISKRIVDISHQKLGADHLSKFFKSYYSKRSKYLHEGLLHSQWPNAVRPQPIIDLEAQNDLAFPPIDPNVLREFVGFILRRTCYERWKSRLPAGLV